MRRIVFGITATLILLSQAPAGPLAQSPELAPEAESEAPLRLLWHVETPDGEVLESEGADELVNPASVVKVATSLWALERLGPSHRFETEFAMRGFLDSESGYLKGRLVAVGAGDPDIQPENLYLVAQALNELGVVEVNFISVTPDYWSGWENGTKRGKMFPENRVRVMAARFAEGLDPSRWVGITIETIEKMVERRSMPAVSHPRISLRKEDGNWLDSGEPLSHTLVLHRSNPLPQLLKRFNAYSNNDIERLETTLGTAEELSAFLAQRWDVPREEVRFESLSGLETNRISPRNIVR